MDPPPRKSGNRISSLFNLHSPAATEPKQARSVSMSAHLQPASARNKSPAPSARSKKLHKTPSEGMAAPVPLQPPFAPVAGPYPLTASELDLPLPPSFGAEGVETWNASPSSSRRGSRQYSSRPTTPTITIGQSSSVGQLTPTAPSSTSSSTKEKPTKRRSWMPGSRKPKEEDTGPPRAWILGHDENQLYDVMSLMSGRPVRLRKRTFDCGILNFDRYQNCGTIAVTHSYTCFLERLAKARLSALIRAFSQRLLSSRVSHTALFTAPMEPTQHTWSAECSTCQSADPRLHP